MITIGGYYGKQDIAEEVAELRERGLAGMKFKVGGLTPEEDAARFRTARAAAGPDFVLCADANQAWTPAEAIRFARLVEDLDLYWFEEPCIWSNDRRAMRDVRFAGGVRVCAGQSEFSAGGCRDLMVEGAIDFCNFDSSWSGGATEWRRVAAAAVAFDVAMAHHEEPQIASHLLASIPHGTFLEVFSAERDPIWWNLVANRPPIVDGSMTLPTRARPRLGARRRLHRGVPGHAALVSAPHAPAPPLGAGARGEGRPRHRRRRGDRLGGGARVRRVGRARRRDRPRRRTERAALAASLPGDGHVGIGADLADVARHEELVEQAEDAVGPLVALAHLAAVLRRRHDIREVDEADWDAQADVNLKATFFLNRAFAERLRARRASRRDRQLQLAGLVDRRLRRLGRLQRDEGRHRHDDARSRADVRPGAGSASTPSRPGSSTRRCCATTSPPDMLQGLVDQVPLGRLASTGGDGARRSSSSPPSTRAYITGATLNISGGWLMY